MANSFAIQYWIYLLQVNLYHVVTQSHVLAIWPPRTPYITLVAVSESQASNNICYNFDFIIIESSHTTTPHMHSISISMFNRLQVIEVISTWQLLQLSKTHTSTDILSAQVYQATNSKLNSRRFIYIYKSHQLSKTHTSTDILSAQVYQATNSKLNSRRFIYIYKSHHRTYHHQANLHHHSYPSLNIRSHEVENQPSIPSSM